MCEKTRFPRQSELNTHKYVNRLSCLISGNNQNTLLFTHLSGLPKSILYSADLQTCVQVFTGLGVDAKSTVCLGKRQENTTGEVTEL